MMKIRGKKTVAMKRLTTLYIVLMCLFACSFTAAAGTMSAQELFSFNPMPDVPLAMDPAVDPLLKLVNKAYPLPSSYKPSLVTPRVRTKQYSQADLRPEAAAALEAMFAAALREGLSLVAVSGYRSYAAQKGLYARSVERNGKAHADLMSAREGTSEHQLGLAMDLSAPSLEDDLSSAFARKKEGKWVKAHCAQFGFIIRYKQEWSGITGYQGEPWHIRYIGREHAEFVTKLDIPFETYAEYLRLVWQQKSSTGHAP